MKTTLLEKKKEGLYFKPGNFFIDPIYPVENALITHAHADHARPNNTNILASKETIDVMKLRYGERYCKTFQIAELNKLININGLRVKFVPSGHILGSCQILVEYKGYKVLISGDYKRTLDKTCKTYQVEKCHAFITEATFGLPIFRHPDSKIEINKLISSIEKNSNSIHLIGVYALGKCQRIISLLRQNGYDKRIYLHGALVRLCEYYKNQGINLGSLENISNYRDISNGIVLCPPSALNDRWSQKFKNPIKGYVSGWMNVRQRIKQKNIQLPIIISDHCDWYEIINTVNDINPEEILVTHGREEALVYYFKEKNYKCSALNLLGYEDEND